MCQTLNDWRQRYGLPERRAIDEHKYLLGIELRCDPGLTLAIETWERQYATGWRRDMMRRDAQEQVRVIESYREELCRRWRREVDFDEAAREWVVRWGAEWRRHRELDPNAHHIGRMTNDE